MSYRDHDGRAEPQRQPTEPQLPAASSRESFQSMPTSTLSEAASGRGHNSRGAMSPSKKPRESPTNAAAFGLPVGQGTFSGSPQGGPLPSSPPYARSGSFAQPEKIESSEVGYTRKTGFMPKEKSMPRQNVPSSAKVGGSSGSSHRMSTGQLSSNMQYSASGRRRRAGVRKYEKFVWENEKYTYMMWLPCEPSLVDQDGNVLDPHQFKGIESGWVLIIDDDTDDGGWTYASVRDHHDQPRKDGSHRKTNKLMDASRRRRWVPPTAGSDGVVKVKASAVRASYEQQLLTVLKSIMTRHLQKHNPMGVLDPISMLSLREPHAKFYEEAASSFPAYTDVSILSRTALCSMFARAAYGQAMKLGLKKNLKNISGI